MAFICWPTCGSFSFVGSLRLTASHSLARSLARQPLKGLGNNRSAAACVEVARRVASPPLRCVALRYIALRGLVVNSCARFHISSRRLVMSDDDVYALTLHSLTHSLTRSLTCYSTFTQGTGKRGTDEFGRCPKRQRKQRKHQMYSNRWILENTCSRRVEYSLLLFYLNTRHKHKSQHFFSVFSLHTFILHPYIHICIHTIIHTYIRTYVHLSIYLSIHLFTHPPIHPYLT